MEDEDSAASPQKPAEPLEKISLPIKSPIDESNVEKLDSQIPLDTGRF